MSTRSSSFVLAMVQADVFGIAIARVLAVQAAEIRIKRRQRAEEEAQKLPVKIVFPLILGIFPAHLRGAARAGGDPDLRFDHRRELASGRGTT